METKGAVKANGKRWAAELRRKGYSRTCYLGSADTEAEAQEIVDTGLKAIAGDMMAWEQLSETGQRNLANWGEWAKEGDEDGEPKTEAEG